MINERNLVHHEMIGLGVEVRGKKGTVVNETQKMFAVETAKGVKTYEKKNNTFVFTIPSGKSVSVDGNIIIARPEDRIRKAFRKW